MVDSQFLTHRMKHQLVHSSHPVKDGTEFPFNINVAFHFFQGKTPRMSWINNPSSILTIRLFNIAVENDTFIDDSPT